MAFLPTRHTRLWHSDLESDASLMIVLGVPKREESPLIAGLVCR